MGRLVSRSMVWHCLVSRSVGQWVGRSICQSVIGLVGPYVRPSLRPSVSLSIGRSVGRSVSRKVAIHLENENVREFYSCCLADGRLVSQYHVYTFCVVNFAVKKVKAERLM